MSAKVNYTVVVNAHEGGVWERNVKALEACIVQAYGMINPVASVRVVWQRLPKGQAFLAGHPSTTTTVAAPMPEGLDQQSRERFMHAVCERWMNITGCDINEIIVNAMAESYFERYMGIAKSRFSPAKAATLYPGLLAKALAKKRKRGYLSFSINMKP